MATFLTKALNGLNNDSAVVTSGFMIGFMHELKFNESTLQNPLSTIFSASISGFITSLGASVVGSILPQQMRFIIPIAAVTSCSYYKYKDLKGPKSTNNNKNNDKINFNLNVSQQAESE
ncbi:hypothetical protein QKU48_gp0754 [Fadolivirus algeromassiliense]|jgi:hypothetical protein|uniref:Uncharacterized protein n=1 Tax=Fadolivirus FV1/VV64 TaxID=3070911 RepID=A0A7D3V5S0_9VIRU|nr:hypothetical protein QKU48_gp0754 [Fadolivirus algeromassiliense]QKF94212.1 hypothetical protein Fadolivirus_1_754 [Fadolivirus FV1/VV64]